MKFIKYIVIALSIVLLAWFVPSVVKLTESGRKMDPFIYYSSVDKDFIISQYENNEMSRKNSKTGKTYNKIEADSILPMLNYRQLLSDGRMPDSIHGVSVPVKQIKRKSVIFKQLPVNKNKPIIPIYRLFESFSGRVDLEMSSDVFRINDKIEFIDPKTNSILKEKSYQFMKRLEKASFAFPAKMAAGNPNVRKAYEEGYFITDSKNDIFHVKLVNGKPFVKNTNKPKGIEPVFVRTIEPSDRSFYAFVFDKNKKLYIITSDNYKYVEIPCPDFNIDRDGLMVLGNMLYWNVVVTSTEKKVVYALDSKSKKLVDQITIEKEIPSEKMTSYMFPFTITFGSYYTEFVNPTIKMGNWYVLFFNLLALLVYVGIRKLNKRKLSIANIIIIAITGIYGLISSIIFKK